MQIFFFSSRSCLQITGITVLTLNIVFTTKLWEILHAFLSADFLQNHFFQEIPSECQTVWIQVRADILSGLIWVQTVCKGNSQMHSKP